VRLPWRKPGVDRAKWPDEYVGPPNGWGLAPGPCKVERKWAGGLIIRQPGGLRSTVGRNQVVRGVANQ
jgi:hypothetical protein